MTPRPTAALILALTLTGSSCAIESSGDSNGLTAEDEAVIHAIPQQHSSSFLSGELEAVVSTYTEDAVVMLPNEATIVGRTAIGDWFAANPRLIGYNAPMTEIDGRGDLAVARGGYSLALQGGGSDSGKYVYVLRKQPDGFWRIAWAIWNSDLPAQQLDMAPITVETERQ